MDDVNPASPSETLEQQEVLRARIWEALENSPAPRVLFERHIPKNEGINVAISLDSFLELLYTSLAIEEDGIWGETAEIVADIFRVVKGGRLEEGIHCDEWLSWLGNKPVDFTPSGRLTARGELLKRTSAFGSPRGSKFLEAEFAQAELAEFRQQSPIDYKSFERKASQLDILDQHINFTLGQKISFRGDRVEGADVTLDTDDSENLKELANLFMKTLKSGWPIDKVTSKGKFVSRKMKLSSDEREISWPSRSSLSAVAHTIAMRDITDLTFGSWGKWDSVATTKDDLERAVSVHTAQDVHSFRMRESSDAVNFIKGIMATIKVKYPRTRAVCEEMKRGDAAEGEGRVVTEPAVDPPYTNQLRAEISDVIGVLQMSRDEVSTLEVDFQDEEGHIDLEAFHRLLHERKAAKVKADAEAKEDAEAITIGGKNSSETIGPKGEGAAEAGTLAKSDADADADTDADAEALTEVKSSQQMPTYLSPSYLFEEAREAQDLTHIVVLLSEHAGETETVLKGLEITKEVSTAADTDARNALSRAGANTAIVGIMQTHPMDATIQLEAIDTVITLVGEKGTPDAAYNAERFAAASGVQAITDAMKRFPENVLLQEKACLLFQAMSSKYTEETLRIANSCECVVLAMKQHPAESSLQAAGCMALSELVKDSAVNVRRVRESGGFEAIVSAMKLYKGTDERVEKNGCISLRFLADSKKDSLAINRLCKAGACEAVIGVMESFLKSPSYQKMGCDVIIAMSSDDDGRSMLGSAGACKLLVSICNEYIDSEPDISTTALDAIVAIAEDHDENLEELKACGLGDVINKIKFKTQGQWSSDAMNLSPRWTTDANMAERLQDVEAMMMRNASIWQTMGATFGCGVTATTPASAVPQRNPGSTGVCGLSSWTASSEEENGDRRTVAIPPPPPAQAGVQMPNRFASTALPTGQSSWDSMN